MCSVNPRGPYYEMLGMAGADRLLARSLRATIDPQRSDGISFDIGARFRSVEHVIGGNMDQGKSPARARFCQHGWSDRVRARSLFDLRLGFIHCRVRSGVHDEGRLRITDRVQD